MHLGRVRIYLLGGRALADLGRSVEPENASSSLCPKDGAVPAAVLHHLWMRNVLSRVQPAAACI